MVDDSDEPARRRRMNADRRRRFGAADRILALLCECGEIDCHRTVQLTAAEYDAILPGVIVHPDHGLGEGPLLGHADPAGEAGGGALELRDDDQPLH